MESICFTPESIRDYIISQSETNGNFLFNELDLQMFVARSLECIFGNGYRVHLEYRLPKKWNKDFDDSYERWGETPYFDIVLERIGENPSFIAIELKYKLKAVKLKKEVNFTRFGITPSYDCDDGKPITLITNQSAENEGRYDFWKDVKRIELLTSHFPSVQGGIALFLTNQPSYKDTNNGNKYSPFNFEAKKDGFLHWHYETPICGKVEQCGNCEEVACGEKLKKTIPKSYNETKSGKWGTDWSHYIRPNFRLCGPYEGEWKDIKINIDPNGDQKENFYCYSVVIPSFSNNA